MSRASSSTTILLTALAMIHLSGCSENIPATEVETLPGQQTGSIIRVVAKSPQADADNVSIFQPISIKFSGAVDINWLFALRHPLLPDQPFRFRVEEFDTGAAVPGEVTYNAANDEIYFQRKLYGGIMAWDLNTEYKVIVENLLDTAGFYIPNTEFTFITGESSGAGGNGQHRVEAEYPTNFMIGPADPIEIVFSEPLGFQPIGPTTGTWTGAIRYVVTDDSNWQGNFELASINLQFHLHCSLENNVNVCRTLTIRPNEPCPPPYPQGQFCWPTPSLANFLIIEVRANQNSLRSAYGTPMTNRKIIRRAVVRTQW